jgi:hypothetical protein
MKRSQPSRQCGSQQQHQQQHQQRPPIAIVAMRAVASVSVLMSGRVAL